MKFLVLLILFPLLPVFGSNFSREFDIIWGKDRAKILNNGQLLTLSLDRASGSAFQSKQRYLFGKFSMQLKLVHGNSAGTVTSYYVSSEGSTWDEIDFEFLGNLSGEPYTVHTNLIFQGKGDREQQFRLWFDPTADFHAYSILWNPKNIIFWVDGTPIRRIRNAGPAATLFPTRQPMKIHSSLWNADDWATRGGRIKTDWSKAPFTAAYRNVKMEACAWPGLCTAHQHPWLGEELDAESAKRLVWVRTNQMIYNYCSDTKRFPSGLPPGCVTEKLSSAAKVLSKV